MDSMSNPNGDDLRSLTVDGKVSLRLWDMDPNTSTVRWIVRNRIVQLLSEQRTFHELGRERTEKIAGVMDGILLARAPSQVHYMNLETLESRLHYLINDQKNVDVTKNLASDVSFSSNGSTSRSCEMAHNMDLSSQDTSYQDASTSSGHCVTALDTLRTSIKNNSASSSLLGSGSTVSRRYLPNGHHRVVANASSVADGNDCPETILHTCPVVSKTFTDDGFSTVIPSNEYDSCWNGHVWHDIGFTSQSSMSQMASSRIPHEFFNGSPSFGTNTDQTIDGASLSEKCDNHFTSGCNVCSYAELINPATSFGLTDNFRNLHQSDIQSYLRMTSVKVPSLCSGKEQFLQCKQQQQLQPSCQRLYPPYNQSDHLQHEQKELYSRPQHFGARSRISGFDQSQSILNWSNRAKDCVVENQSYNESDQLQDQRKELYFQEQHLPMENRKSRGNSLRIILNGYNLVSGCVTPVKSQKGHHIAQQFYPSIEGSKRNLSFASEGAAAGRFGKPKGEKYTKYREFRVLYHHVLCCTVREGKCDYSQCMDMKLLLDHISNCSDSCSRKHCSNYKKLLTHFRECRASTCCICGPDKMGVENNLQGTFSSNTSEIMASSPTTNTMEHEQPPLKRTKTVDPILFHKNEISNVSIPVEDLDYSISEGNTLECQESSTSLNATPESMELDTGPSSSSSQESNAEGCMVKIGHRVSDIKMKLHLELSTSLEVTYAQPEKQNTQVPVEADEVKLEGSCINTAISDFHLMETKPRKLKKGVSLIDSFNPEKIREHINSLREPVGQSKQNREENQGSGHATDMNTCSLCVMKDLRFDPPPRYCAKCYKKINPKGVFYSTKSIANGSDSEILFCRVCIDDSSESVDFGSVSILKANLGRRKNYGETYDLEWWVQCDKCKAWQHQICSLFNPIRNDAVQSDHTCPDCILQEIESGVHKPLSQSTILGAKDLPTTTLSDHIEEWVFRRLEEERRERANSLGKTFSEVPAAEGLVVRVVSSVVKKLEVKQVFRDVFQETYPSEFPYKSKAILLFQNIDGADVCLFGMYVQEYGSGCPDPNRRRVSISYIDSVKYFRPKVTAATGEALRTFVYHEILVGYLDYCKKRGFISCHIWACPPLERDDDYILYCHPKIQKMPKFEKLREWYQTIIRKAEKEDIVVEYTNIYDHFFVKSGDCKAKMSAARLPYFDSDYWPGQAEVFLQSEDSSKPQKNGRKATTDRVLRAFRRDALIENPKDILLMYRLGNKIRSMKENFIIAHLWHVCKHCCHPILSGKNWVCSICKNFKLCHKCFLLEQSLETKDRHPSGISKKHSFQEVQMVNIPEDVIDDDEAILSEIFDTRLMFLSHCQNNHYQFDTLRRAKHSTMMILYNLNNPFSPLVSACIGCHDEIDTAEGWHCLSCSSYDLCDSCYQKGAFLHEHELVRSATVTDHTSQQSNQSKQVLSLQELSGAPLLHASKCGVPRCTYPYCRKLKGLFHHSAKCQTRVNGGCEYCRKIWYILRAHAQSCGEPECHAPRCKDLKEHLTKKQLLANCQQLLEDSRRRAGANKQRMKERIMKQKNSVAIQAS